MNKVVYEWKSELGYVHVLEASEDGQFTHSYKDMKFNPRVPIRVESNHLKYAPIIAKLVELFEENKKLKLKVAMTTDNPSLQQVAMVIQEFMDRYDAEMKEKAGKESK